MYTQVEKTKENKSRAVANSVAQKKRSGKQGFGFVDNRPEAIVQRKLKLLVNNKAQDGDITQKKESKPTTPNNLQMKRKPLGGLAGRVKEDEITKKTRIQRVLKANQFLRRNEQTQNSLFAKAIQGQQKEDAPDGGEKEVQNDKKDAKPKEGKSSEVIYRATLMNSNRKKCLGLGLVGKDPEIIAQRKIQEIAINSSKESQLGTVKKIADKSTNGKEKPHIQTKDNNHPCIQLQPSPELIDLDNATHQTLTRTDIPKDSILLLHYLGLVLERIKKLNEPDQDGKTMQEYLELRVETAIAKFPSDLPQLVKLKKETAKILKGAEFKRLKPEIGLQLEDILEQLNALEDLGARGQALKERLAKRVIGAVQKLHIGPGALTEIKLGGSNKVNNELKFGMMKDVVDRITAVLNNNETIKGNYMLGGSYAAALRGTSRPPQDVDIDFLTEESYIMGTRLVGELSGAQRNKGDDSITTYDFVKDFQRMPASRVVKVTIKIELVNVATKNINKNVKPGMQTEMLTTDLHPDIKIPTIGTMIINWMDRYIEAQQATDKVDKDKSKRKGDLTSIREIRRRYNILYGTVKHYMVKEKPEYQVIWNKTKPYPESHKPVYVDLQQDVSGEEVILAVTEAVRAVNELFQSLDPVTLSKINKEMEDPEIGLSKHHHWEDMHEKALLGKEDTPKEFGVEVETYTPIKYIGKKYRDPSKSWHLGTFAKAYGHLPFMTNNKLLDLHLDWGGANYADLEIVSKPMARKKLLKTLTYIKQNILKKKLPREFKLTGKILSEPKEMQDYVYKTFMGKTIGKIKSVHVTTTQTLEELLRASKEEPGKATKIAETYKDEASAERESTFINKYLGEQNQWKAADHPGKEGGLLIKHAAEQFHAYTGTKPADILEITCMEKLYRNMEGPLGELHTKANKLAPVMKRGGKLAFMVEYRGATYLANQVRNYLIDEKNLYEKKMKIENKIKKY